MCRACQRVAVMLHPTNEEWQAVLTEFAPDVLQTDCGGLCDFDVPDSVERWPVLPGRRAHAGGAGDLFYEGAKSGQGETVDWSRAATIARMRPDDSGGRARRRQCCRGDPTVRPFGVDVSSGVESAPGQKDPELIREFINAAKAAEKSYEHTVCCGRSESASRRGHQRRHAG